MRAYCQARIDEKWKHVVTVHPHESAAYLQIVKRICELLHTGELSYSQARELKKVDLLGLVDSTE